MEKEISEAERLRRQKVSEYRKKYIAEKRRKGFEAYIKRIRKEKAKRLRAEKRKKEKEKEKKRLLRERQKEKERMKKPVGRPKKRGPKKKYWRKKKPVEKKKVGRKPKNYRFKIISCKNGRQNNFVGKYETVEEAYEVLSTLMEKSKSVVFPQMVSAEKGYINSISEYLLIESTDDDSPVYLRNEYGKLVEQELNYEGWKIIDKMRYQIEETFWVYGYNNKTERKTFEWICSELLMSNIYSRMDFKRVLLYKNKVIFKNDDNSIDMVLCKNESDSVRLYNEISKWVKNNKIKQVYFVGDYSAISPKRKALEAEIIAQTGWPLKKIQMKTTKFKPE